MFVPSDFKGLPALQFVPAAVDAADLGPSGGKWT
jgi:predicted YcjX-like family ATPase